VARKALQPNPPWITAVLSDYWDILQDKVPAAWLPKLDRVHPSKRAKMLVAHLSELGCGAYGCVLPTLDDTVVLKVTTDETEAKFASEWTGKLVAPVVVDYELVIELEERHEGRPLHLLWRRAADHVGDAGAVYDQGANVMVDDQQTLGAAAFDALWHKLGDSTIRERLRAWLGFLEANERSSKYPGIGEMFSGMRRVFEEQHVLFGDVHAGNIGLVSGKWVIVDPGNVAVVPKYLVP
jgi:hypothetical protein